MSEFFIHNENVNTLLRKRKRDGIDVDDDTDKIKKLLTNKGSMFKIEQMNKKVQRIIKKVNENPTPNVYGYRMGQMLIPILEGNIQYGKL